MSIRFGTDMLDNLRSKGSYHHGSLTEPLNLQTNCYSSKYEMLDIKINEYPPFEDFGLKLELLKLLIVHNDILDFL